MVTCTLPRQLSNFEIERIEDLPEQITIYAHPTTTSAHCPTCGQRSTSIHSYYERHPRDWPMSNKRVSWRIRVRRFRCQNKNCGRALFAERLAEIPVSAQRTTRFTEALQAIGLALGGEAGKRLAAKLKFPTSGDTLLRVLRRFPIAEKAAAAKVIGVDDWAYRRGHNYGTLLVDLERHQVIELLPTRTAEALAEWLQRHPTIQTIARDRSGEYKRGILLGAPQAQQIADRWHLLVNLRESLERLLDRLRPELMKLPTLKTALFQAEIPVYRARHRTSHEQDRREGRRSRRLQRYRAVQRLHHQGVDILHIARQLKMSRMTVYRYLSAPEFPEWGRHPYRGSILNSYEPYLIRRWREGCRNASELWREVKEKGYPGSRKQVTQWVYERREEPAKGTPKKYLDTLLLPQALGQNVGIRLPANRRLVWALLKSEVKLTGEEREFRRHMLQHSTVQQAYELGQGFLQLIRQRQVDDLDRWLACCQKSTIKELANFATGLLQDYQAVKAAVEGRWSNGQTEGQINRLKCLKRQMYGRAKFDLLRQRMLSPA